MKISITLPSLRPEALYATINNIVVATRQHELEVLVCTPFRVHEWLDEWLVLKQIRVVCIEDTNQSGSVAAHAAAARQATGELITAFVDDHAYVDGWDAEVVSDFLEREAACGGHKILCLGLRQVDQIGTVFGIYYPYFPMMRRSCLEAIGGWFDDTQFKRGFGDADLGLRVWAAGGRCEWSRERVIEVVSGGPPDWHDDLPRFLERWAPTHGLGWVTSRVRAWDIDVPLSEFPLGTRTCYANSSIVGNRE